MTEENKKENIAEEIQRAEQALGAANLLFENGFLNDSISKLYYFLLYNIRALLLIKGFQAKSHEGALRLFALHFVKKGVLGPADSHVFSKLMKYREEADYSSSYVFTDEDYVSLRKEALTLSEKVKAYLIKEGYLSLDNQQ